MHYYAKHPTYNLPLPFSSEKAGQEQDKSRPG